jgi:hypothetical protein
MCPPIVLHITGTSLQNGAYLSFLLFFNVDLLPMPVINAPPVHPSETILHVSFTQENTVNYFKLIW